MHLVVFLLIFIVLTLLHAIVDFALIRVPLNISLTRWSEIHGWLSLNPLHVLCDSYLSRHRSYSPVEDIFWFWLGFDQLLHVLFNLIWAYLLTISLTYFI